MDNNINKLDLTKQKYYDFSLIQELKSAVNIITDCDVEDLPFEIAYQLGRIESIVKILDILEQQYDELSD